MEILFDVGHGSTPIEVVARSDIQYGFIMCDMHQNINPRDRQLPRRLRHCAIPQKSPLYVLAPEQP